MNFIESCHEHLVPTNFHSYSTNRSKVTVCFISQHFLWNQYAILLQKLWNHKGYVNWVHKDTTIEKMDGCNWCRQITDLFQFIHARNQGGFIINNYDISLLQFLFCKNTVNLKEWVAPLALLFCYSSMDGCNWNCELSQYFWKKGWLQMLVSKKHSTTENNRSLQKAFWNNDGTTQMYGCKFSFEITICFK